MTHQEPGLNSVVTPVDDAECWDEASPLPEQLSIFDETYQVLDKAFPGLLNKSERFNITPFYGHTEQQAGEMIAKLKEYLPLKVSEAHFEIAEKHPAIIVRFIKSDKAQKMFASLKSIAGTDKHALHQVDGKLAFSPAIIIARLNLDSEEFKASNIGADNIEAQIQFLKKKIVNLNRRLATELTISEGISYNEYYEIIGMTHPPTIPAKDWSWINSQANLFSRPKAELNQVKSILKDLSDHINKLSPLSSPDKQKQANDALRKFQGKLATACKDYGRNIGIIPNASSYAITSRKCTEENINREKSKFLSLWSTALNEVLPELNDLPMRDYFTTMLCNLKKGITPEVLAQTEAQLIESYPKDPTSTLALAAITSVSEKEDKEAIGSIRRILKDFDAQRDHLSLEYKSTEKALAALVELRKNLNIACDRFEENLGFKNEDYSPRITHHKYLAKQQFKRDCGNFVKEALNSGLADDLNWSEYLLNMLIRLGNVLISKVSSNARFFTPAKSRLEQVVDKCVDELDLQTLDTGRKP